MKLTTSIEAIGDYLSRSDMAKPRLAIELYRTKTSYNWKETEYKTWRGFCNLEVALSQASIYRYLKTAELIYKFEYTLVEVLNIVIRIGWSRFQLAMTKLEKYEYVDDFVEKFQDLNLNEKVVFGESDSELIPFSFSLPAHTAELLTNELLVRGMRVNKHNRTNASAAMVKLVRDLTKE